MEKNMGKQEDKTIILRWSSESLVAKYCELDDLIYETSGDIFSIDENENREFIGKFRVYYVDVERTINEGESVFHVLDAHSKDLVEYYEPIFGSEEPYFNNNLLELFYNEVLGSNILVLDRLEILPQYRGKKLGIAVLCNMIARFAPGAAIVAMKPCPLQFEVPSNEDEEKWRDRMSLAKMSTDQGVATKKLCNYYSKLGFLPLSGTPMMFISTAFPLPTIEDVFKVNEN
jgi:hypothetical protein